MHNEHLSIEPNANELDQLHEEIYEAPAVESVMTSELLEREVHYAGVQPVSGGVIN